MHLLNVMGRMARRMGMAAVACGLMLALSGMALAQTGGEGAIEGSVTDATGAVVAGATVTARKVDTGVETVRTTSSSGLYNISPLSPGTYRITVVATGFQKFVQENQPIDAMHVSGLNVTMKIGAQTDTVTITDAPPALDTADATLGGVIKGEEYTELPLLVSGNQQRDITQFENLLPGAQTGSRTSVVGGTQTRLGEVYIDGLPLTTISQQGDNRPILNVVPLEAIDQVKVVTSGYSAEYQGAGLVNFNLKSGTNKYHGTVADFIRNTAFDTWGFSAPWVKVPIGTTGTTGYQNAVPNAYGHISKPAEHANELSASIGGPVIIPRLFDGRDKLFFQITYDRLQAKAAPTYGTDTLPTLLMRQGDFTEQPAYPIYDPTSFTCPTPTTCARTQFAGIKNGVPTPNVIPTSELSPISLAMQKFLPAPVNGNITNNYVGGIPTGYQNYLWSNKIDYSLSSRQRLAFAFTNGRRHAVPYTSGSANLPVPYLAATESTVVGDYAEIEHTYTISSNIVNQFKIGYAYFGGPPTQNSTEGISQYEATTLGITGLPTGQASDEFPGAAFSGTNAPTNWSQPDITSKTVTHTYDVLDNVEWVIGKHALNLGIQLQDLMENVSTFNSFSAPVTYTWSANDTAQLLNKSGAYSYNTAVSGLPYASYILGAVDTTSTTIQPFSDIGDRYHPISPYFQDDYKITPKLTLNIGLRWDYIPGFRETLDRWSFLNPTLTNPYTGNAGSLQFAGNYGGSPVSCGCRTPVNTYWKNFGPRLGFAYAPDDKTVFRGGFAIIYSHGGGTGGAGATATGQSGFNQPISFPAIPAGTTSAPVFYLNNSAYNSQLTNTAFGGPTYVQPAITAPSAASQLNTTQVGNFVNSAGAFVQSKVSISYADPYYGDRTPTLYYYNFGIQRSVTSAVTLTANWAGSISHFLSGASNIRGVQSGQINPVYLQLGGLLTQAATPTNVAAAQAILPGCCGAPYAGFTAAAQTTAGAAFATIGQGLKWMPQYTGTADPWGAYSANAVWNALEISLAARSFHGLTFNLNYTYSKELDDAGTQRSGFAIPASATLSGQAFAANRIDRGLSVLDVPQNLAAYGVYKLPFGKGKIGNGNMLVRAVAGGWELSGVMTYSSGLPIFIVSSACTASTEPGQGQCMADVNPNFAGHNIRQNGKWGNGVTATTLGTIPYISGGLTNTSGANGATYTDTTPGDGIGPASTASVHVACAASTGPFCNSGNYMIGDAPRAPFNLRGPNNLRITSGLRRTFDITERAKFTFGVDCQNLLNSVTFGGGGGGTATGIGNNINSATFGTLNSASSDSRDIQFSGRISF